MLDTFRVEFEELVTDGNFMSGVSGGVLGAGKALASGLFAFLTVMVLTLYFLACRGKGCRIQHGAQLTSTSLRLAVAGDHASRRQRRHRAGGRRERQRSAARS